MIEKDHLNTLADRFDAKAKSALKTECSRDYQNYWRGYAEAMLEAADALRTQGDDNAK